MSRYSSPSHQAVKAVDITQEKILAAKWIFQEIILTRYFCTCGKRSMELYMYKIFELLGDNGTLWPEELGFKKFDLLAYDYFLRG